MRIANNIDRELTILDIIARLSRARPAFLALSLPLCQYRDIRIREISYPVVKERLHEARGLLSGSGSAILIEGAERAGTGNLLAGAVTAAARLNAVDNSLEVDQVSGRAVRWAEPGAAAVDTQSVGRRGKGEYKSSRRLHLERDC